MLPTTQREILVHIGMRKTGSSSIQHYLHSQREILLSRYSINYPKSLENGGAWMADRGMSWGNVGHIYNAFEKEKKRNHELVFSGLNTVDILRNYMTSKIAETQANITIFSSEWLGDLSTSNSFWNMLKQLQIDYSSRVRVVVYIREPFSYLLSLYKFMTLVANVQCSFDGFIKEKERILGLDFFSNIDYVTSLAEANEIITAVYVMEEVQDVAAHFVSQVLGISSYMEFSSKLTRSNRGPSYAETFFCRGLASTNMELAISYGYERRDNLRFSHAELPETDFQIALSVESRELIDLYVSNIRNSLSRAGILLPKSKFTFGEKVFEKIDDSFQNYYDSMHQAGVIVGATAKHGYFDALKKGTLSLFGA